MGNTYPLMSATHTPAVHPHTHGEHGGDPHAWITSLGSSPHAWGTPPRVGGVPRDGRFIPTRMGNTGVSVISARFGPVHPHTHGEHRRSSVPSSTRRGSSPHAWGTLFPHRALPHVHRFIPTRMGNTVDDGIYRHKYTVHPHTHGEHTPNRSPASGSPGSSPHAWGTRPRSSRCPGIRRFIPTRMGNTRARARSPGSSSVHPHTHGEHRRAHPLTAFPGGSSPHAWGTHRPAHPASPGRRFIPTRMGNTDHVPWRRNRSPVHPHTHGEHGRFSCPAPLHNGSSPHAWGTQPVRSRGTVLLRFIPTRMGNTRRAVSDVESIRFIPTRMGNTGRFRERRKESPVHPHTHGEHKVSIRAFRPAAGSSPHAWGTPRR